MSSHSLLATHHSANKKPSHKNPKLPLSLRPAMRKNWWKILSFLLLVYTVIGGFLMDVPIKDIIYESIRNLYFHVCMWFAMMILFTVSIVYSVKYLSSFNLRDDIYAKHFAAVGTFLGILGYATGSIWANYTWVTDAGKSLGSVLREPKLIGAAIALLIYGAYFVLRGSFTDIDKRARISAVYNIFAFALLFPTIWIIPRILPSLHPGGENGNPALDTNDVDSRMRLVFYPAIIGWTLLGVWITSLKIRLNLLKEKRLLQ